MIQKNHIIFDFDGVIADTNEIRIDGFEFLFSDFPRAQVQILADYCRRNGGMSRYEKIRYFFEKIRKENIDDAKINLFAQKYSAIVKHKIIEAAPIEGSLEFLSAHRNKYDFAVVSGSDQEELRDVCVQRKIDHFFIEILGSPISKKRNLAEILSKLKWQREDCLFVGDSINDLQAARENGIDFIGRDSGMGGLKGIENIVLIPDLTKLSLYLENNIAVFK